MKTIKLFCDICQKECFINEGMGSLAGAIIKLDAQLKKRPLEFQQDFCPECCEVILNFLKEFKENAKDNSVRQVGELPTEEISDSPVK